jgi:hypothetical protein
LRRRGPVIAGIAASLVAFGLMSRIVPSGYTRIDLKEDDLGRGIFGVLVQDQVTFSVPGGPPPPRVSPRDVDDLYHTGGAFDARGLSRPFHRIVYRVGEIGDPKLLVRNRTVSFKQAAGFGGRLVLTMTRPTLHEILRYRFAS